MFKKIIVLTVFVILCMTYCITCAEASETVIFNEEYEDSPQEKILVTQLILPCFDVWRHSCGRWQDTTKDGRPDIPECYDGPKESQYFKTPVFHFPGALLEDYILTRAVIRAEFPSPEQYDHAYETYQKLGEDYEHLVRWTDNREQYVNLVRRHVPVDWNIREAHREDSHGVRVSYGVRVSFSTRLAYAKNAFDLKEAFEDGWFDPATGEHHQPRTFSRGVRGYRWYMPGVIEWYGVPRNKVGLKVASLNPVGEPRERPDGTKIQRWNAEIKNIGSVTVEDFEVRAYMGLGDTLGGAINSVGRYDEFSIVYNYHHTRTLQPGQRIQVSYEAPAPTDHYDMLLTVNMMLSRTWNGEVRGAPEIARTVKGRLWENTVSVRRHTGVIIPNSEAGGIGSYYQDNIMIRVGRGVPAAPPPEPIPVPEEPDNLAVVDLRIFDRQGNEKYSVTSGQPITVRAKFFSNADEKGPATLRIYRYNINTRKIDRLGSRIRHIRPGETLEVRFDLTNQPAGNYLIFATINYRNTDGSTLRNKNEGWIEELFNNERESTYEDNKLAKNLLVTATPRTPPQTRGGRVLFAYPRVKWVAVPVYVEYEKPVRGWKEVPFIPAPADEEPPRVRVRLVE